MKKSKVIYLLEEDTAYRVGSIDTVYDLMGYTKNVLLAQKWCREYNHSVRRYIVVEEILIGNN